MTKALALGHMEDQEPPNRSIEDVIELMEREVARLKTALETIRLTRGENRAAQIRWHVDRIEERQDRLDELKRLIRH